MSEQDGAVMFESGGLPDLGKVMGRDHLREWVKHIHKGSMPELVDDLTDHYWKLLSSLHQDDYVIAVRDRETLALGELTSGYRYDKNEVESAHSWPVRWVATDIPAADFKQLQPYFGSRFPREIPESEARIIFRKYIPSWQTKGHVLFRWVSTILLLAELAYFWPRK